MHSVEIFVWDTDYRIHGTLIGVNILLLISLILRFEWPLIKKRFQSNDENIENIENTENRENIENAENIENMQHNDINRTNGLYPETVTRSNRSNLSLNHASVQTVSHTQSPQSRHNILNNNDDDDDDNDDDNILVRETTNNTLGIQINTNPSTPSASPTPVPNTLPNTPDINNIDSTLTPLKHDNNNNNNNNNVHPPLSALPSDSKLCDIQLAKVKSGKKIDIEDEKYIISYPNEPEKERIEMAQFNKSMADDVLTNLSKVSVNAFKNECISERRRRASIDFYKQLFNPNNFDMNGKLLTAKKRKKQRNKANKKRKRKRREYRNDSQNLMDHQRSFKLDIDDDIDDDINDDIVDIDVKPQIFDINQDYDYNLHAMDRVNNTSTTNVNFGQLLKSKIYDDEDKKSVRYRYRYILYFPLIIYCLFGIACLVISGLYINIELYIPIMYGYPALEIILSLVLWCQIDIVILSCGGSHIVEECLEVQISANGHEYKCIYCCWCDCAVLRFCNSCTHDNGFSLFKCHHKFMKIVICLINPLLTIVYSIISEFDIIYIPLHNTKIGDLSNSDKPNWLQSIDNSSIYWLIFIIVSVLYIILMFTATYIGILIVKSLHFVSSLNPKILTMQYITSIILTFIMQIQFIILLLYYNLIESENDDKMMGLCAATPFYMILVYIEFIIASIINHFSFRNKQFDKFGKEAIKKNEVQLFDFQPNFDGIHDLHNYRRVYGDQFLWDIDHKNIPFLISDHDHNDNHNDNHHHDINHKLERPQQILDIDINAKNINRKSSKKSKKKKIKTPLITDRGIITVEDTGRPTSATHRKKSHNRNKKKKSSTKNIVKKEEREREEEEEEEEEEDNSSSLSLSFQNATFTQTTVKETGHHHPTTTTSLSLDLDQNHDDIRPYSLDEGDETNTSSSNKSNSWNNNKSNKDNKDNKDNKKLKKHKSKKFKDKKKDKKSKTNNCSSSSNSSSGSNSSSNSNGSNASNITKSKIKSKLLRIDSELP